MAITAWSAKVLSSSIWAARRGLAWLRPTKIAPMGPAPRSIGTASRLRKPSGPRDAVRVLAVGQRVLDVDDRSRQDRARGRRAGCPAAAASVTCPGAPGALPACSCTGREVHQLAVEPEDGAQQSVAQPHGASHDRIEDRLDVRRRLADHAQDLARRGLLLQRLAEIAVARLQLLEQPRVLDRDHRLVGERAGAGRSGGRRRGRRVPRETETTPMGRPSCIIGTATTARRRIRRYASRADGSKSSVSTSARGRRRLDERAAGKRRPRLGIWG